MAKQTLETFIEKVKNKHGEIYDFSKSKYQGLDKEITYICPKHGEVTQIAKKVLTHTGCPICDQEKAKKNRRSGKYSRTKGNNYEVKIAHELADCGYPNVVTSRSESKRVDNSKVDLIDLDGKLPIDIQIKCTSNTPSFFKIRNAYPRVKPFAIFWNSQVVKEGQVNMNSQGELVMIDKDFFYELLKCYNASN